MKVRPMLPSPTFHLGGTPTAATVAAVSTTFLSSNEALAADTGTVVASAFASYGHTVGLVIASMALVAQRFAIREGMGEEDLDVAVKAQLAYAASVFVLFLSGYVRVAAYGKGVEFYSHESIFWVKMVFTAVLVASSIFPAVKLGQCVLAKGADGDVVMSPKLVKRMTSLINAQLTGLLSIPLTAALMTRGVGYMQSLPWQFGAAPVALAFVGLSIKYGKEALTWNDSEA